ncbi:efflux RND transporter permease subunit, partial [Rhizobium johnstonii]
VLLRGRARRCGDDGQQHALFFLRQNQAVVEKVEKYYRENEKEDVDSVFGAIGFGFSGSGQNSAIVFTKLKDFSLRTDQTLSAQSVVNRAL